MATSASRVPHPTPTRPLFAGLCALLTTVTTGGLAGCNADIAGPAGEPDVPGATVGELETLVFDYPDGVSERQHFLVMKDKAQTRLRLHFDGDVPASLSYDNRIALWGRPSGIDSFQVTRYQVLKTPETDFATNNEFTVKTAPLIGAPVRPKTAAFVLVDLGSGVNVAADAANTSVFSPGKNFASVYDQLSHGIFKFTGDVVGPFMYPMTTCDYSGLVKAVKPMVTGTYNHYMWYLGSNVKACAWSGIGSEGNVTRPQSDAWYNASTGCTVLVQEVGHNLGWMHSSTMACAGAQFADDPTTCTSNEYGNRMTPMGMGCGQLNGHDMWYQGLIGGCNGVKVTATGTFNLFPLETPCNAIQTIQIPMLKTGRMMKPTQGNNQPLKNYYLEFRGPWGLDTTGQKTPVVYVYAGDDIHAASKSSNWSWLLDMVPTSANSFDGLTMAGTTKFEDPAGGITITLMSADTTKAVVQIDITGGAGTAPTCMDNTMLTAPGPLDCGSGPGTGTGGATGTGTGGAAGTGGRPGTGGTTGTGGRGGAVGTGTGGVTGSGGRANTGGASSGGGTVVSSGGAPGSGGAPVTGSGGAPVTGSGGATTMPDAGGSVTGGGVTGGCACSTTGGGNTGLASLGIVSLLGLAVARRRRRK